MSYMAHPQFLGHKTGTSDYKRSINNDNLLLRSLPSVMDPKGPRWTFQVINEL